MMSFGITVTELTSIYNNTVFIKQNYRESIFMPGCSVSILNKLIF